MGKKLGFRIEAKDPQLNAMKALLATLTDPIERDEVQWAIELRIAELNRLEIDESALPVELRKLLK